MFLAVGSGTLKFKTSTSERAGARLMKLRSEIDSLEQVTSLAGNHIV